MILHAINTAITFRQCTSQTSFNWLAGTRGWLALLNKPGKVVNKTVHWADGVHQSGPPAEVHDVDYNHTTYPFHAPFVIHMEEGHD